MSDHDTCDIPEELMDVLTPDWVAFLDEHLGLPVPCRPPVVFSVEIDLDSVGVYTLTYDEGQIVLQEGFSDDEPFLTVVATDGTWPLVRNLMQHALDGFPDRKDILAAQDRLHALDADVYGEVFAGLRTVEDAGIRLVLKESGDELAIARGPADAVTRWLEVTLSGKQLRTYMGGEGEGPLKKEVQVGGNRSFLPALTTAFKPLIKVVRNA